MGIRGYGSSVSVSSRTSPRGSFKLSRKSASIRRISVAGRARNVSRIVVGGRDTVASAAHAPGGFGEVAHGGVEKRFGGLVHGRARREGSRSLE